MKQNSHFNRVVLSGNSDWYRKSDRIRRKQRTRQPYLYTTFSK